MINAIIVEDEGVAARKLKSMLVKENIEVEAIISSNKALQQCIRQGELPDLLFLDIHLSDGIVFDTLQSYPLEVPIIFTTAYDEFAIKAFKQNSVDYLLKPIDAQELHAAIEKFKAIYQSKPSLDVQKLVQLFAQEPTYKERIKVKVGEHFKSIKLDEVSLLYSASKITFIQIANGRSYPIDRSLDNLITALNPHQFFRVNRAQIVHIDYIKDVVTYSTSRLKVFLHSPTEQEIIVARERVKDFKEWLG